MSVISSLRRRKPKEKNFSISYKYVYVKPLGDSLIFPSQNTPEVTTSRKRGALGDGVDDALDIPINITYKNFL